MTETDGSLDGKKVMFRNRLRDLALEFEYLGVPEGEALAIVKECYQQEAHRREHHGRECPSD